MNQNTVAAEHPTQGRRDNGERSRPISRRDFGILSLGGGVAITHQLLGGEVFAQSPVQTSPVPRFQVDPTWPQIPNGWILGPVSSIRVDSLDHVWILQRPRSVPPEHASHAAPAVLEFDGDGRFVQGWGGPGAGYEWPGNEHGFAVDPAGYIWIAGNHPNFGRSRVPKPPSDDMLLKFTTSGKFVMQVGRRDASRGNADIENLHEPAELAVHRQTNEIFVADGYGNRRVIVLDADSGKFKRMWGAFGNTPLDDPPDAAYGSAPEIEGDGPPQFGIVHGIAVSDDGLVYVADRDHRRIQVFTLAGEYMTQSFVNRDAGPSRTATGLAFSPDRQQRFMYVTDFDHGHVFVLDRQTLSVLDRFGEKTNAPGDFLDPHYIAADSKGNIYTSETAGGRRAQKFVLKSPALV